MIQEAIARVYLHSKDDMDLIVTLPGTKYQLYLEATTPVTPSPQGRLFGIIQCPVYKVDFVSAGGAYIEPVTGRPRRVQGKVIATILDSNSVVLDVCNTPIVGRLPDRWQVSQIEIGTRLALDIPQGASFAPSPVKKVTAV